MPMTNRHQEFQLTSEELGYLRKLALHDEFLSGLMLSQESTSSLTIRLRPADAEQLREHLTTHLARVGFDESYLPNKHGLMLEKLIDRFFLR